MGIRVDSLGPEGKSLVVALSDGALRDHWGEPPALADWRFDLAEAHVHVRPAYGGVDLAGTVAVEYTAPCSRCLRPLTRRVEEPVALRFERPRRAEAPEHEIADSEFDVLDLVGDELDLQAWLAEQVSLVIDDHPVCGPEAAGTCRPPLQVVGGTPSGDPRWAALKRLKLNE